MIAVIYTEAYGRQSFMVNGARSKRSVIKTVAFQPLYLLDLEIYYKPGREIHRLKDLTVPYYKMISSVDRVQRKSVIFTETDDLQQWVQFSYTTENTEDAKVGESIELTQWAQKEPGHTRRTLSLADKPEPGNTASHSCTKCLAIDVPPRQQQLLSRQHLVDSHARPRGHEH